MHKMALEYRQKSHEILMLIVPCHCSMHNDRIPYLKKIKNPHNYCLLKSTLPQTSNAPIYSSASNFYKYYLYYSIEMNNTEIMVALAFDVANMESVNNARACKHAYLYENNNTLNIFFLNIYEMIQFCILL